VQQTEDMVLIPRIPLIPSDTNLLFSFGKKEREKKIPI
jgi:hypothetical protein